MKRKGKLLSIILIINLILILALAIFTILTSAKINGLYHTLSDLSEMFTNEAIVLRSPVSDESVPGTDAQTEASLLETASSETAPSGIGISESLPQTDISSFASNDSTFQTNDASEDLSSGAGEESTETATDPILSELSFSPASYAGLHKAESLPSPVDYSDSEVLSRLRQLAEEDEIYEDIYSRRNTYPYGILRGLINNPELLDHVKNFDGIKTEASGGITEDELHSKFPLFLQWDERWGYVEYGTSMISIGGCGPVCLSMVLFSLTRDESFTPDFCANYAMEKNYFIPGTGTKWALFETAPKTFGVSSQKIDNDIDQITEALEAEKMLVFSVAPGHFTTFGHFIVIYGMDEEGLLLVNDPNCVYRSTVHWDYEEIKKEIKAVWSFEKAEEIS